jgi:dTDP-L-rhamnose 4-epimerase
MGGTVEPHVSGEYRLGDIRHNFADVSRLQSVTGFRPAISTEEGLRRFCDWVRTQPLPQDQLDHANAELKARKLMA